MTINQIWTYKIDAHISTIAYRGGVGCIFIVYFWQKMAVFYRGTNAPSTIEYIYLYIIPNPNVT